MIIQKLFRVFLFIIFWFDFWHTSPKANRDYVKYVLLLIKKKYKSILDIGCGLGDIAANTHCEKKYFVDIDNKVLRAAKFLSLFNPNTWNSENLYINLNSLMRINIKSDVIVCLNFFHNISEQRLKKIINNIYNKNLNKNGMFIFDIIKANINYKYNHNLKKILTSLMIKNLTLSKKLRFSRFVVLIKKNRN